MKYVSNELRFKPERSKLKECSPRIRSRVSQFIVLLPVTKHRHLFVNVN